MARRVERHRRGHRGRGALGRVPVVERRLGASASAANLRAAGLAEDLRACARESAFDVVPRVDDVDAGVALITT